MRLKVFVFAGLLFSVAPALAQESPQPGDACTAGQIHIVQHVGGPENPGVGYDLVCNGTNWKHVMEWDTATGRVLFQVNNDAGSCTAAKLGRIRYNGTSTWEYCNNALAWTALGGGPTSPGSPDRGIQFNSGGAFTAASTFVYTSAGRVGIGTATPSSTLHVYANDPEIVLDFSATPAGDRANLNFRNNGTEKAEISYSRITGDIWLDAENDVYTLDNVGIGTAAPTHLLNVKSAATGTVNSAQFESNPGTGSASYNAIKLSNTNTTSFKNQITFVGNGAEKWSLGNDESGNGTQNFFLWDSVASSIRLFVTSTGAVGIGNNAPASRLVVAPPGAQTIAGGNIITADACGTIKQITSAGAVTTNTADTFTAPAAANTGCCMDVINTGANNITLDANAKFKVNGAPTDQVLGPADAVRVCSNGTAWYQMMAVSVNQ